MRFLRLIAVVACVGVLAPLASAQTIDDFESADLSAWNVEAPYYTSLAISSPGASGSNKALSITEIAGQQGGHSASALVHRNFASPQDWTSAQTLELDAKISGGEWSGYSIRLYNDDGSVLLRGLHSDSGVSGFRTLQFSLVGVPRDKVTEMVVYVNRTNQDAGQTLTLDNIRLSATPVSPPTERVLENFSGGMADWTSGGLPAFVNLSTIPDNAPGDPSAPASALQSVLAAKSSSALFRWDPPQTMDWNDYQTLEFDVKLPVGTVTDGFSVKVYNAGAGVRLKKFVPQAGYVTCQVDISAADRDQINEVLFYVNRVQAYDPTANPAKPQTFVVDNIRLTNNAVASSPNVIFLHDMDNGDLTPWERVFQTFGSLGGDAVSAPYSLESMLVGTSSSAYIRESFINNSAPTMDWEDYNSLMFEAKVVKGDPDKPNYPVGFSATIINGGVLASNASGPGGGPLWFFPSAYDQWETYSLDLNGLDLDQVSWIWWYQNRCSRNDYSVTSGLGQVLKLDNIRVSKEPAPPLVIDDPNVDDFEDGQIPDWYYSSQHTDSQTGEVRNGATTELTTDASSGQYAVTITCNTPPGSSSAYVRKTLQAKWSAYKTLLFDAKVADSNTSEGFALRLRSFNGYADYHPFLPTNQWQTFSIDISGDKVGVNDARNEVVGLLFYVNRPNGYGIAQSGSQKLYLDNIRLSTEAMQTSFNTIGEAKSAPDGQTVNLTGKVSSGSFTNIFPDKGDNQNLRPVFFLIEPDRSAALPVVIGTTAGLPSDVPEGNTVSVTGVLTTTFGVRYLYATGITITGTGAPIPDPLVMVNKALGSGQVGLDAGVPGFQGLETQGHLVVATGKILAVGSDGAGRYWLYLDDGSGVTADNGATGVKVYDWTGTTAVAGNVGRYATVTGFVMNDAEIDTGTGKPTGNAVRAIWPKKELASPIQLVN